MEKKIGKFYKINDLGEIFRFRFNQSELDEDKIIEILSLKDNKQYTQQLLADKFNTSSRNIRRIFKCKNLWVKLVPEKTRNGYRIQLSLNNDRKHHFVHRLVLEAFVGPCPYGMVCCHNDGNNLNNKLKNLRWDTHKANEADKLKHGTRILGEKHHQSKLKNEDITIIRLLSKFLVLREIAEIYNISIATTQKIIKKSSWSHVL